MQPVIPSSGKCRQPYHVCQKSIPDTVHGRRHVPLTPINILLYRVRNTTLVLHASVLGCQLRAVAEVARVVHSQLQRVTLPAEDVVAVLGVAGASMSPH